MDLKAIKERVQQLTQGRPKKALWKPTAEHVGRLLPLPGDEDLAKEVRWHYGVGEGGFKMYCPGTHGDQCDFCDLVKVLRSWKDEDGKDKPEAVRKQDWEWVKKIDAGVKKYAPIVLRKADSADLDGPFWWEMSPKTYTALFTIVADDDWNAMHKGGGALKILTSATEGLDLTITLKKAGQNGNATSYDITDVKERKMFSPLLKDQAACKALLDKVPSFDNVVKPIDSAEASRLFAKWKGSMSADVDPNSSKGDDGGIEHGTNGSETAATGGDPVDAVVNRLKGMIASK